MYPSPGFSAHWNQGAGKAMLKKLGTIPSKEVVEQFNVTYHEYDMLTDNIYELFDKLGHREAHALLNELLDKGLTKLKNVPTLLQKLFEEVETRPTWLNEDLLHVGSSFCRRSGPFGLLVLRNYSLMGGYESAAINKPLIYTGALKGGPAKRLSETLSFWVDVTGEHALNIGAAGFKSAVKVRVIHAIARAHIYKSGTWSDAEWGIPLNQGDMVATNLGFSLVFLEGLRMQGFRPSTREVEGLLHLWKYIGYLLGIPASYLPNTEDQAIVSMYKWTMTQPPADDDTKTLALALVDAPLYAPFPPKAWQRKLLSKVYLGFSYFFLGKAACKRMSLPNTMFRYLPYVSRFFNRLHEYWVWASNKNYVKAVIEGRKEQVEISAEFLKGYESKHNP